MLLSHVGDKSRDKQAALRYSHNSEDMASTVVDFASLGKGITCRKNI
jgi:hypothetical protein